MRIFDVLVTKYHSIANWYSGLHIIWKLLIIAEMINVITCAGYRIYMRVAGNLTANMIIVDAQTPNSPGQKTATVCFGGAMSVEECFKIFKPYCEGGEFIYMGRTKIGYDLERQIQQVEDYVIENNITKLRVIGISVGDYAARFLEDDLECEVVCLAVNPEPDCKMLKPWSRVMSYFGGGVFELGSALGGWGGFIECIPKSGEWFSLAYTGDQFFKFASVRNAPYATEHTIAVIISRDKDGKDRDEFLKNKDIEEYFKDIKVYWVDSNHGNTIDKADAYCEVLDQIFPDPRW